MSTPAPSLLQRALQLLATREHSRAELQRRLTPYAPDAESLTQLLDTLQARDFINEARVVDALLNRRASKLGAARIRQELQAKGLEPATVANAVDDLRATELARARAIWDKKFGKNPRNSAERARQMRFLAGRGFGGDVIRRVVQGKDEE